MVGLVAATGSVNGALLLAEAGGVFLLLGLIAYAAAKLRFSPVPFFLLAGLAFGEGGISDLSRAGDYLDATAQIGALLLLLLLGLEYSAREISSSIQEHRSAGLLDFALNAVPGALVAWYLGWGWLGIAAMAGVTYVSSSGIASQLIRDSGWQRSEVARRTVSVLVLEDLVLAPYLPLVTGIVLGIGVWRGLLSVGAALAVTGLVLVIGVRGERQISSLLNSPDPRALLLTVFGAALLGAGASELLGLSGAVAAFLVGLVLSGEVAATVRLRLTPLRDLASSVFFLFFGLTTDPRDLPGVLPLAVLLAVVGTAGKFAVARWTARGLADPMSWRRVGAFLTPRGEFSILIGGLVVGVPFSGQLQALTTAYVILTAAIGSGLVVAFQSRFAADRTD